MKKGILVALLISCCHWLFSNGIDQQNAVDSLKSLFNNGLHEELIYYGQTLLDDWPKEDTLSANYARVLLDLGRSYIQLEAFPEALEYNKRALRIFLDNKDSLGVARTYSNFSGVYFYTDDSAKAFHYLDLAKHNYPKEIDNAERARFSFMAALLHLEFGSSAKAFKKIDSLIQELESSSSLAAYVAVTSLGIADSLEFVIRYPQVLSQVARSAVSTNFQLTALLEASISAIRFGRLDIVKRYYPQLEQTYLDVGSNASISQQVDYHQVKANLEAYEKDFESAFQTMKKYGSLLVQKDSIQGKGDLHKLETQIRIKDSALRTKALETELAASKQRGVILVALIVASLIAVFSVYRININTRERNKAIAEIANTRGRMISILSHDIRTPLGQLSSLLDQYQLGHLEEADLKVLLDQIKETTELTTKMLDNTVSWINLNRADFRVKEEEVVIGELFKDLQALLNNRLLAKNVNLKVEIGFEFIRSDRFLLQTALFNLLSNAIKFSSHGDQISLRAIEEGTSLKIEVEDQGLGIDPKKLADIQAQISTSTMGTKEELGSGLGLVIVHDAVEKLKARFEIESKAGKGTLCRIVF